MGKRELLLVVIFAVLGTALYQVTAPPAQDGATGFSLRDMFRAARGHMGDLAASRAVTRTGRLEVPPEVEVVTFDDFRGRLDVVGADIDAIDVTVEASLHGLDEADLDQQEAALVLDLATNGRQATIATRQREMSPRVDETIRVRVPRRLALHLGGRGVADVRGVASAHFDDYRGDLVVEEVAGPITGSHREGRAEFGPGTALDFETRRGTLRLVRPASVTLDAEATDIEVTEATGPVSIDQSRCTIEVVGGDGTIKVRGGGGTIKLRSIRSDVDIDAERLTVSMIMAAPAPARVAIEADDVEVTLPPGGVNVTATIEGGPLRAPAELATTTEGNTRRATGALGGGGPLIDVIVARGSLTIRTP